MKLKLGFLGTLFAGLICQDRGLAVAPTTTEIKKVLDYYHSSRPEGPVLMKLNVCLTVDTKKGSKTRYECQKSAKNVVSVGSDISAWTSWFVPQNGTYDDVMIQFVHDGVIRSTRDVKLTGGLKMRAFRSQRLHKKGLWEIRVLRKKKTIASTKFTVK